MGTNFVPIVTSGFRVPTSIAWSVANAQEKMVENINIVTCADVVWSKPGYIVTIAASVACLHTIVNK